jgi:hypothetical protein
MQHVQKEAARAEMAAQILAIASPANFNRLSLTSFPLVEVPHSWRSNLRYDGMLQKVSVPGIVVF